MQQENKKVVDIKDVSFEVMERMIDFVYEDKVKNMDIFGKLVLKAATKVKFIPSRNHKNSDRNLSKNIQLHLAWKCFKNNDP